MIPTPGGEQYRFYIILNRAQHRIIKGEKKDNEMITICFCVGLSRGPLRSLPDSAWVMARSDKFKKTSKKKMHHVILQQELPGGSSRIDVRRLLQCHPFPCCNDLQKRNKNKIKRINVISSMLLCNQTEAVQQSPNSYSSRCC